MAEKEKSPVMHRGLPCFEWDPGVEIEDTLETEDERAFTIANGNTQGAGDEQQLNVMQPKIGEIEGEQHINE